MAGRIFFFWFELSEHSLWTNYLYYYDLCYFYNYELGSFCLLLIHIYIGVPYFSMSFVVLIIRRLYLIADVLWFCFYSLIVCYIINIHITLLVLLSIGVSPLYILYRQCITMYKSVHLQAGFIHIVLLVLRFRLNLLAGSRLLGNQQIKNRRDKLHWFLDLNKYTSLCILLFIIQEAPVYITDSLLFYFYS